MLKELLKIANRLDALGLTKEADHLDRIIYKIAVPIVPEGIFRLDPNEPRGYPIDYDENGDEIVRPVVNRNFKRLKNVLRDKRNRERLKNEMSKKRLPIEEQEEEELAEWYAALQNFGDNVILIPFDKEEVNKNLDVLEGIGQIFGIYDLANYEDLYRKANMQNGYSNYTSGNLDTLKENFPSLWSDIQGVLSANKLQEEDAVYMFYNQDSSPTRPAFTKDPYGLGHDMGHNVFDSESGNTEFKDLLKEFVSKAFKLYISEDGEAAFSKVENEIYDDSGAGLCLSEFFSGVYGTDDIYADVFADAAAGRLTFEPEAVPDSIWIDETDYYLSDEKRGEVENLLSNCINDIKTFINPNHQYGTFAPGPLAEFAGSVVLNDV